MWIEQDRNTELHAGLEEVPIDDRVSYGLMAVQVQSAGAGGGAGDTESRTLCSSRR